MSWRGRDEVRLTPDHTRRRLRREDEHHKAEGRPTRHGDPALSPAGYSGTPLVRKLGIKEGFRIAVTNPPAGYWDLLGDLPNGVREATPRDREVEFSHVFATTRTALLAGLAAAKGRMASDGMVWLSWPKKASGVATELDGNVVRGLGLDEGLVDIKVCAVDDVWSGLKFVIRVKDRA